MASCCAERSCHCGTFGRGDQGDDLPHRPHRAHIGQRRRADGADATDHERIVRSRVSSFDGVDGARERLRHDGVGGCQAVGDPPYAGVRRQPGAFGPATGKAAPDVATVPAQVGALAAAHGAVPARDHDLGDHAIPHLDAPAGCRSGVEFEDGADILMSRREREIQLPWRRAGVDHPVGSTDPRRLDTDERAAVERRFGHILEAEIAGSVGHHGLHRPARALVAAATMVSWP